MRVLGGRAPVIVRAAGMSPNERCEISKGEARMKQYTLIVSKLRDAEPFVCAVGIAHYGHLYAAGGAA